MESAQNQNQWGSVRHRKSMRAASGPAAQVHKASYARRRRRPFLSSSRHLPPIFDTPAMAPAGDIDLDIAGIISTVLEGVLYGMSWGLGILTHC